jgi:C_GCAxxG_C_C family probable redox protein
MMKAGMLTQQVVDRVADCFDKHNLCCSESIVVVLNRVFKGGLSDRCALQAGTGFCNGMGGAGCSCGALTGSVMMLSLFLGNHFEQGLSRKKFRRVIKRMHDDFRRQFGSTCCRILSKKVKHDKKAHHANCLMLTKGGVELAVSFLLESRPDLLCCADTEFLRNRAYPVSS